ncbi:hypothetical protein MMC32_007416 [Xylographa parallela]|nr:hypothetical protein [Xylographa parallela]
MDCDLPRLCFEENGDEDCGIQEESPLMDCDLPTLCLEESVAGRDAQDRTLVATSYQAPQELSFSDNDWASFLPTNTQVERELSEGNSFLPTNTQVKRKLSEGNPIAPTFAAMDDADPLRASHSEHCGLQNARDSFCEVQSHASRQQDDLAQIPPFSTQDLEFSADELTELMSPARFPEAGPILERTSSAGQFNPSSRKNQSTGPAPQFDHISNSNTGTSIQQLAKKPATTLHPRAPPRPPQHPISKKPAPTHKPPAVERPLPRPRPRPHPPPTTPSTTKIYVLADREAIPGHAKHVLHRLPSPAPPKSPPKQQKTVFGAPVPHAMRPPPRRPLAAAKGNTARVAWSKRAVPSAKAESRPPAPPSGENKRPSVSETAAAGFDFGDGFLSTQELLEYVV